MNIKITFLEQNIRNQEAFSKGVSEVEADLATIKVNLIPTFRKTTKVFTTQLYTNQAVGTQAEVVPEEILSEVDGTEDIAFLLFSNANMNPKPLNPVCNYEKKLNAVPCQMCEEWYNDYDNVFEEFVEHELCHAESFRRGKTDITHLLSDGTLQAQMPELYKQFSLKQPKEWYIYLLNSLINTPVTATTSSASTLAPDDPSYKYNTATGKLNPNYKQPMQTFTLKRVQPDDGVQTIGIISDGTFTLKTLERPWLNNEHDLSCIPKGTYQCTYSFSLSHLGWTYEVLKVPNRDGIRIHAGNDYMDSEGCILLGTDYGNVNNDKEIDVINSKVAINNFVNYLQKKDFILVIE